MQITTVPAGLLEEVEAYVERFIDEKVAKDYVYHNFQHTYAVVEAAGELATQYELSQREVLTVRLAAWFHDLGYRDGHHHHEARSAEDAEQFLRNREVHDEDLIAAVRGAILATRMPQQPQNLLEEIVGDADLSHLGDDNYWDRCGRVRQELALTRGLVMSDQEWVDFELAFMLGHKFHTEAARELFGKRKGKHIKQLYKRKQALLPDQTPHNLRELEQTKKQKKKPKKREESRKSDGKVGRGVETMFRTTYRTHVNLSSIADNKANIMLSVNAIILSISAANLFPKLDTNPHLLVPTIILVGVCLASLFFAIQATRPKVTEGNSSLEDIRARRSNLLFFGNFYNMELEAFQEGMKEMIEDEDFLYSSMTRDLYYLGVVLAKKYAFLRICYNIFLFGLILAVLGFVAASVYYNERSEVTSVLGF